MEKYVNSDWMWNVKKWGGLDMQKLFAFRISKNVTFFFDDLKFWTFLVTMYFIVFPRDLSSAPKRIQISVNNGVKREKNEFLKWRICIEIVDFAVINNNLNLNNCSNLKLQGLLKAIFTVVKKPWREFIRKFPVKGPTISKTLSY